MKIKILATLSFGILANCLGCASTPMRETKYGPSFQTIRTLPFGTEAAEIEKRFGKPDIIENVENADELWVYLFPKYKCCYRTTLRINHVSKTLDGKDFAFSDENESEIKTFLSFFPGVKFKSARRHQTTHEIPNQIDFASDDAGIYFTLSDARQEVEDVSFINTKNKELVLSTKQWSAKLREPTVIRPHVWK